MKVSLNPTIILTLSRKTLTFQLLLKCHCFSVQFQEGCWIKDTFIDKDKTITVDLLHIQLHMCYNENVSCNRCRQGWKTHKKTTLLQKHGRKGKHEDYSIFVACTITTINFYGNCYALFRCFIEFKHRTA